MRDLRSYGAQWVETNIGAEYVDEFCAKYDAINRGIPIGGFQETVVFLDMVETIRKEMEETSLRGKIKNFIRKFLQRA